jgi:hypothetical protein
MSDNTNGTGSTVTYGDHTIDVAALPEKSVMALIRRGVAHYLGNEQASKVSGWKAERAESGNPANDAEVAAYKADRMAEAVKALMDGTIGSSIRGPRGTAVDTVIRQLAETEVKGILKANGLSMPSGDKVVEFADGTRLTRGQLIDRRITNHGDRLRKEAEAKIKADERKAQREVDAAKAAGGQGVEALGL